ncbi:MAG: sigma factor-like helix-turn-helix DNA-binding protein [Roseiflexaceae bacterium]|nr:sigma factor-like helix-turn-helix DNA-binding protein [Roseiflexaceae bacterium]
MSSINGLPSPCSLNGHSIRLLGLSPETEAQLHRLGIFTLEQLAQLAMNRSGADECDAVEAIQRELAARLAPRTVSCFSMSGFAAHFIIHAEGLFFFQASVIPDDQESWTCSYQWYVQGEDVGSGDDLMFFHDPLSVPNSSVSEHDNLTSPQIAYQSSVSTDWETNGDDMKTEKRLQDAPANLHVIQKSDPFPGIVEKALKPLNERERRTLELRYGLRDGEMRTLEVVGNLSGCTRERVRQIEQKALKKIRTSPMFQEIQSVLSRLETDLESAGGVLPIMAAAHRMGLLEAEPQPGSAIVEAWVRFLLSFSTGIDLPKNATAVALQRLAGAKPAPIPADDRQGHAPAQRRYEERVQPPILSRLLTTHAMKTAVEQQTPPFGDSYDVWNHAIATYVIAGAQRGSIVYLSIDDEVIEQIARRLTAQAEHPLEPFLDAVRRRVVRGRRVELQRIQGRNRYGEPNSIAFLSAMVLAASCMAEDEEDEIASSNYFTRFCEVLQLDQEGGRPLGMKAGVEEPLWREWTIWLGEHGLISSARRGEGAGRYTNYPISQALLRGTDRDRLYRLFRESKWSNDKDIDTVMAAVRRAAPYLTKHLQSLLHDESQRAEAIAEAIYDAYESWAGGEIDGQTSNRSSRRYLSAGIWRSEDVLSGAIEYFVYPQSPRRQQFDEIIVHIDGREHTLRAERPGWYMPLCPINEQQLNRGAQYPIKHPPELEALVLSPRTFWILRPDPDNSESGVYASWGRAPLGVPFMILCRRELIADLEELRSERLIEWSDEPKDIPRFSEWVEVRHCMVISPIWDGVEIKRRDLHDALRPKERLSIGLSGGLRAPQGGWLVDMGPQITIFGFPPEADIRIVRLRDDQTIFEETKVTNRPFDMAWQTPGAYRIEAVAGSCKSESLVKIVDWDNLEMASIDDFDWPRINGVWLRGALFQSVEYEEE